MVAAAASPHPPLRPFLKWAGGKRQLLAALTARMPATFGTYYEPFVGGGAVFFALAAAGGVRRAVLADVNERLIRTYRGLRDDVDGVIGHLRTYRYEKEMFYAARARAIDGEGDAALAAWFIYLNRAGYNGLYRVNRDNQFNVPFGRYENPTLCDEPNLRACARALDGVDLRVADFAVVSALADRGDLVYFDPPYVPLSATSSFTSYTAGGFGAKEQTTLRDVARGLKARGVHVLLSNSSAPLVRDLYAGFEVDEVRAIRAVNSKAAARGSVAELIIR